MKLLLLISLLLWPAFSWAAISEVASQRVTKECAGAFDTCDIVMPNNITAGNLLTVAGGIWHNGGTTSLTVTGCSTSFAVLLGTALGTGFDAYKPFIAYGIAGSTGACTLTVDGNNTDDFASFSADEFTKAGGSTIQLDVNGGSTIGSGNAPSDSLTTLTANALLIGALTTNSNPVMTPSVNYTEIGQIQSASNTPHSAVFRIATTVTSYTVDWSLDQIPLWTVQTAAFKEVVVGGGTCQSMNLMGVGC